MQDDVNQTLTERGGTYGDFRDNARISQNIKKAIQDSPNWHVLPPYVREGLELVALKISRILSGDPLYHDNFHDLVGYAKLMEDRAKQDIENGVVIKGGGDPLYPPYEHVVGASATMSAVTLGTAGITVAGNGFFKNEPILTGGK